MKKKTKTKQAFKDAELISMDVTLAKFIAPRLKRFSEVTIGYPGNEAFPTFKSWKIALKKMHFAFDFVANEKIFTTKFGDPAFKKVDEGLALFAKHYLALWW